KFAVNKEEDGNYKVSTIDHAVQVSLVEFLSLSLQSIWQKKNTHNYCMEWTTFLNSEKISYIGSQNQVLKSKTQTQMNHCFRLKSKKKLNKHIQFSMSLLILKEGHLAKVMFLSLRLHLV
ncbi:uncharacterized protein LOC144364062, partial [Saccoglossus kowalevskii]